MADRQSGAVTIRLRVRGQIIAVGVNERDPSFFSLSIAYSLPEWSRDRAQNAPILLDAQGTFKAVKFFLAHDGAALVAAIEQFADTPAAFTKQFWRLVEILRDAGAAAIERILDRSESKIAAERFINDFMRGNPH